MASSEDKGDDSGSPGFAMKLTIAGIARKFPSVRNISTGTLADWQRRLSSLAAAAGEPGQTSQSQNEGNQNIEKGQGECPRQVVVLDARPDFEYNIGHIPGSIRVEYEGKPEELVTSVPGLTATDDQTIVVCYCSVGYRSSVVAKKLQEYHKQSGDRGPTIYNLEGSIFKWANEGRAMVDGKERTTRFTHPYNTVFGKLLNSDLRRTEMEGDKDGSNKL